jgi:hypothetical protein
MRYQKPTIEVSGTAQTLVLGMQNKGPVVTLDSSPEPAGYHNTINAYEADE